MIFFYSIKSAILWPIVHLRKRYQSTFQIIRSNHIILTQHASIMYEFMSKPELHQYCQSCEIQKV